MYPGFEPPGMGLTLSATGPPNSGTHCLNISGKKLNLVCSGEWWEPGAGRVVPVPAVKMLDSVLSAVIL